MNKQYNRIALYIFLRAFLENYHKIPGKELSDSAYPVTKELIKPLDIKTCYDENFDISSTENSNSLKDSKYDDSTDSECNDSTIKDNSNSIIDGENNDSTVKENSDSTTNDYQYTENCCILNSYNFQIGTTKFIDTINIHNIESMRNITALFLILQLLIIFPFFLLKLLIEINNKHHLKDIIYE